MLDINIQRFGGDINPDNSIQLFVVVELASEVGNHKLTKNIQLPIPSDQIEIYDLVYKLQPLVYQYCHAQLTKPPDTTEA